MRRYRRILAFTSLFFFKAFALPNSKEKGNHLKQMLVRAIPQSFLEIVRTILIYTVNLSIIFCGMSTTSYAMLIGRVSL